MFFSISKYWFSLCFLGFSFENIGFPHVFFGFSFQNVGFLLLFGLLFDNIGFPCLDKEFFPHITLARVKYPQKHTPDISMFLKSSYDPIDFTADRVQFLSSELLPSGTFYTLLGSFPFGESL